MDNRYRSSGRQQGNRDRFGSHNRQDEQFNTSSDDQYGEPGWRTQENERWQSGLDFDRGYGRDEPMGGSDWSRPLSRSDTSSLDDYDRPYGGSRYAPPDRQQRNPYGRSDRYGSGDFAQFRDTTGYGADRYGQGGYSSGSFDSGSYRSDSQRSGHIPPRRFDPDERGFFDRASDEVMSWFGDDEAARRRQMDHREDHRGKGPAGYTRSKERILEDANERLMHDSSLDASNIAVDCEDNEITLSGTVDSRAAKRRAEDIVEQVSGVKHVQNNLRVQPRETYYSETSTLSDS